MLFPDRQLIKVTDKWCSNNSTDHRKREGLTVCFNMMKSVPITHSVLILTEGMNDVVSYRTVWWTSLWSSSKPLDWTNYTIDITTDFTSLLFPHEHTSFPSQTDPSICWWNLFKAPRGAEIVKWWIHFCQCHNLHEMTRSLSDFDAFGPVTVRKVETSCTVKSSHPHPSSSEGQVKQFLHPHLCTGLMSRCHSLTDVQKSSCFPSFPPKSYFLFCFILLKGKSLTANRKRRKGTTWNRFSPHDYSGQMEMISFQNKMQYL